MSPGDTALRAGLLIRDASTGLYLGGLPTGWHGVDLLKGHVDAGENSLQCACREAKEEANLDVNPRDCKSLGRFPFRGGFIDLYHVELPSIDPGSLGCPSLIKNAERWDRPELNGLPEMSGYALIPAGDPQWQSGIGELFGMCGIPRPVQSGAYGLPGMILSGYSPAPDLGLGTLLDQALPSLDASLPDLDNLETLNSVFADSPLSFSYEPGGDYKYPSVGIRHAYLTDCGSVYVVLGEGWVDDWTDSFKLKEVLTALRAIWAHEDTHLQQGIAQTGVSDDPSDPSYGSSPQAVDAVARQAAAELTGLGYDSASLVEEAKDSNSSIWTESNTAWEWLNRWGDDSKLKHRFLRRFVDFLGSSFAPGGDGVWVRPPNAPIQSGFNMQAFVEDAIQSGFDVSDFEDDAKRDGSGYAYAAPVSEEEERAECERLLAEIRAKLAGKPAQPGSSPVTSRWEPCSDGLLARLKQTSPLLTAPMGESPMDRYMFLSDGNPEATLAQLIQDTLSRGYTVKLSLAPNGSLSGVLAYLSDGGTFKNIKMFSTGSDNVFLADMWDWLADALVSRNLEWSADQLHPYLNVYKAVAWLHGGSAADRGMYYIFTVPAGPPKVQVSGFKEALERHRQSQSQSIDPSISPNLEQGSGVGLVSAASPVSVANLPVFGSMDGAGAPPPAKTPSADALILGASRAVRPAASPVTSSWVPFAPRQLESDPELAGRLNVRIRDGFTFLSPSAPNSTLAEYLSAKSAIGGVEVELSTAGTGSVVGAIIYHREGALISHIKAFSLPVTGSGGFRQDLWDFIAGKAKTFNLMWQADSSHPYYAVYSSVVEACNGNIQVQEDNPLATFRIPMGGVPSNATGFGDLLRGKALRPKENVGGPMSPPPLSGVGPAHIHKTEYPSFGDHHPPVLAGGAPISQGCQGQRPSQPSPDHLLINANKLLQSPHLETFKKDGLTWVNSSLGLTSIGLGSWGSTDPDIAVVDGIGLAKLKSFIRQATVRELIDEEDLDFYSRSKHKAATKRQGRPDLVRVYASTVEWRVRSENFHKNQTNYRVFVLMKDFVSLAKDRSIPLEEAIEYSLNHGDVTVSCTCPSFLYHGFSYLGTQLGYKYGLPRENRFPRERNPGLRGSACKHVILVLEDMLKSRHRLFALFGQYYKRLQDTPEGELIAIPNKVEESGQISWDFGDMGTAPESEAKTRKRGMRRSTAVPGEFDFDEVPAGEIEPEQISARSPSGETYVSTKMAEDSLPEDSRHRYAGEEEPGKGGPAVGEVTDGAVAEMEQAIDEADPSTGELFPAEDRWELL